MKIPRENSMYSYHDYIKKFIYKYQNERREVYAGVLL